MTVATSERTAPALAPATNGEANIAPRAGPVSPALAAALSTPRGGLAKALAAAVKACHSVQKDSQNSFHRYAYASADAIIAEAREALASAELALLPVEATLDGTERDGPDRFELRRTFLLVHSSGESAPLHVRWPVVPDKGRPLDKATAAADTLSLSYLLRDLLLMPRVDPADDVSARDDRQQRQQPAKAKEKPKAEPPADGAEFEARVQKVDTIAVKEGLLPVGEVVKAVQALGLQKGWGSNLVNWPAAAFREGGEAAKAALRHARAAKEQVGKRPAPADDAEVVGAADVTALQAELARVGEGWPGVQTFLKLSKMSRPKDLSRGQWSQVMARLKPLPDAPKK